MLKAHHHNKLGRIAAASTSDGDAWDDARWRSAVANSEDAHHAEHPHAGTARRRTTCAHATAAGAQTSQ